VGAPAVQEEDLQAGASLVDRIRSRPRSSRITLDLALGRTPEIRPG